MQFNALCRLPCATRLICATALLVLGILGCGVSSEDKGSIASSGGQQIWRGQFNTADGKPLIGSYIYISSTERSDVSDNDGNIQLSSEYWVSGDVEVVAEGTWGTSSGRIENVPPQTADISFSATVNEDTGDIAISDLTFDGDSGGSPTPLPTETEIAPEATPTPSEGGARPPVRATATPRPGPTVKPKPTKSPSTKICTACHEDRGSPRCGDAGWEAQHRVVWRCSKGKEASNARNVWFDIARVVRDSDH